MCVSTKWTGLWGVAIYSTMLCSNKLCWPSCSLTCSCPQGVDRFNHAKVLRTGKEMPPKGQVRDTVTSCLYHVQRSVETNKQKGTKGKNKRQITGRPRSQWSLAPSRGEGEKRHERARWNRWVPLSFPTLLCPALSSSCLHYTGGAFTNAFNPL